MAPQPYQRRLTVPASVSDVQLGACPDSEGVHFAIYSDGAEAVELILFDPDGHESGSAELDSQTDGVWQRHLPQCQPGQHYGYRIHGRFAPDEGLRFNPHKLVVDPYARKLSGPFRWSPSVFDSDRIDGEWRINKTDSAAHVPKGIVVDDCTGDSGVRPDISWADTIIYEANVRGYTMRCPEVSKAERGTFRGLSNGNILAYLKALGITTVELMPVFEFVDEIFLHERNLKNFWGYNSINFFVPSGRYTLRDARAEFLDMVRSIHDAGLEVVLDVAYNHTGEGDELGPTISFRGIDNLTYYRTAADNPGRYINDTGCGNTINTDHPRVRALIVDSLRYWASTFGIDGFRFDLAATLGRTAQGFNGEHVMLEAIGSDALLSSLKLIAEPWDAGPGGYQLGGFPRPFSEWNDRYRDSVRRFWRGDRGEAAQFAKRLHGSSDLFEHANRSPHSSINFVTSHDGFTLFDLTSYEHKHNEANREHNRDGHDHNYSCNYGVEGDTDNSSILALRRKQRLNMLTTLLLSQGTPMLLAGDEFGNSQGGNNNAYAQDNGLGWLDWSGLEHDASFQQTVRQLIRLRKENVLFRQDAYRHGQSCNANDWQDIAWLRPDGEAMQDNDWDDARALCLLLTAADSLAAKEPEATALLMNTSVADVTFRLPVISMTDSWRLTFASDECRHGDAAHTWLLPAHTAACVTLRRSH